MAREQVAGAIILDRLRERIVSGIYFGLWRPGERLPSIREIAEAEGVDRAGDGVGEPAHPAGQESGAGAANYEVHTAYFGRSRSGLSRAGAGGAPPGGGDRRGAVVGERHAWPGPAADQGAWPAVAVVADPDAAGGRRGASSSPGRAARRSGVRGSPMQSLVADVWVMRRISTPWVCPGAVATTSAAAARTMPPGIFIAPSQS